MNIRFNHVDVNPVANDLAHAAAVVLRLAEQGITVYYASSNGRRPEIYVDRFPHGVVPGMKRSTPGVGGGRDVVLAAEYHSCQLQMMQHVPGPPVVLNPELQVVANG